MLKDPPIHTSDLTQVELTSLDYLATALFLFFLAGEAIADFQMYQFQTEKYARIKANLPADNFCSGDFLSV